MDRIEIQDGDEYRTKRATIREDKRRQYSRYWELIVECELEGIDYHAEFLVPTY